MTDRTRANNSKVRFIKPPNKLKAKVGSGGISPALIEKAQEVISNNNVDFIPMAQEFLDKIAKTKAAFQKNNDAKEKEALAALIMQLKASGGMFQYQLVSEVADSCLHFFENCENFNKDAFIVLQAHENTIKIIIKNKLKGDGGKEGYALVTELHKASQRFFAKHHVDE